MDAADRFGTGFLSLGDDDQDQVLVDLEEGEAPPFIEVDSRDFFVLLRQHTIEGMFSDPMYGGNRGMVGWELIGWPGAQRAYSPAELTTEDAPRPPQAMSHLPGLQRNGPSGRDATDRPIGRGPVLPRSGSDESAHHPAHHSERGAEAQGVGSGRRCTPRSTSSRWAPGGPRASSPSS